MGIALQSIKAVGLGAQCLPCSARTCISAQLRVHALPVRMIGQERRHSGSSPNIITIEEE
jgi:hypothetical protein